MARAARNGRRDIVRVCIGPARRSCEMTSGVSSRRASRRAADGSAARRRFATAWRSTPARRRRRTCCTRRSPEWARPASSSARRTRASRRARCGSTFLSMLRHPDLTRVDERHVLEQIREERIANPQLGVEHREQVAAASESSAPGACRSTGCRTDVTRRAHRSRSCRHSPGRRPSTDRHAVVVEQIDLRTELVLLEAAHARRAAGVQTLLRRRQRRAVRSWPPRSRRRARARRTTTPRRSVRYSAKSRRRLENASDGSDAQERRRVARLDRRGVAARRARRGCRCASAGSTRSRSPSGSSSLHLRLLVRRASAEDRAQHHRLAPSSDPCSNV